MNRAYILGPHKIETLTVPVKKYPNHALVKDIEIDISSRWNKQVWKTIENSYKNSPYFIYFQDYLYKVFAKNYKYLIDLNLDSLTVCLHLAQINKTICLQEFPYDKYNEQFITFNAKNRTENDQMHPFTPYLQNFGNKFESNLSILDLLFQQGPNSLRYLS